MIASDVPRKTIMRGRAAACACLHGSAVTALCHDPPAVFRCMHVSGRLSACSSASVSSRGVHRDMNAFCMHVAQQCCWRSLTVSALVQAEAEAKRLAGPRHSSETPASRRAGLEATPRVASGGAWATPRATRSAKRATSYATRSAKRATSYATRSAKWATPEAGPPQLCNGLRLSLPRLCNRLPTLQATHWVESRADAVEAVTRV